MRVEDGRRKRCECDRGLFDARVPVDTPRQAKEDFVEQSLITQTISLSLSVSVEIKGHNPVGSNGKTKSINKASVLLSTPRWGGCCPELVPVGPYLASLSPLGWPLLDTAAACSSLGPWSTVSFYSYGPSSCGIRLERGALDPFPEARSTILEQ